MEYNPNLFSIENYIKCIEKLKMGYVDQYILNFLKQFQKHFTRHTSLNKILFDGIDFVSIRRNDITISDVPQDILDRVGPDLEKYVKDMWQVSAFLQQDLQLSLSNADLTYIKDGLSKYQPVQISSEIENVVENIILKVPYKLDVPTVMNTDEKIRKKRYFVIVPRFNISSELNYNNLKDILSPEALNIASQSVEIAKFQGMYKSTDSSNKFGFKDTYFPFLGQDHSRWIEKEDSSKSYKWRNKICNYITSKEMCEDLNMIVRLIDISNNKLVDCCDLYDSFLNKFAFWFQVRLSARLGGDFWKRKDMNLLRGLAMHALWNDETNEFEEDINGTVTGMADILQPDDNYPIEIEDDPVQLNLFLNIGGARCGSMCYNFESRKRVYKR